MRPPAPWAILHVDLEDIPGRLDAPAEAAGVVLYFRAHGIVLGMAHELPHAFPMGRGEIARRAALSTGETAAMLIASDGRPLGGAEIEALWSAFPLPPADAMDRLAAIAPRHAAPPPGPEASIVICTSGRPADLADCLSSLSAEIDAGREVIVVDNGPDAETEATVRARPGVRYVAEPVRGLSRARNTGIAAARGEVVVFVDDDVRPEPGWLVPLLAAFGPGVDVVCGLALPATLDTDAQIAFQYDLGFGGMGNLPRRFDREFLEAEEGSPPVWNIGAGANMAVRRAAVLRLGGFDERVGPGAAGGCGDDSEYWHRVLHAGGTIVYQPFSVVRHRHRRSWPELERQAYGYGLGHIVALFAQYGRQGDMRDLWRALWTMPRWLFGRALRAPLRAALGRPDRLAGPWCRGYLSALRHLPLAFRRPPVSRFGDNV